MKTKIVFMFLVLILAANDNMQRNTDLQSGLYQPLRLLQQTFRYCLSTLNDNPANSEAMIVLFQSMETGQISNWNKIILGSYIKDEIDLSEIKTKFPNINFEFLEWNTFGNIILYTPYPEFAHAVSVVRKDLSSDFHRISVNVDASYISRCQVIKDTVLFDDLTLYGTLEDKNILSFNFSEDSDYVYEGYDNKIILRRRDSKNPIKEFSLKFSPYGLFEIGRFLVSWSALAGEVAFTCLEDSSSKYFEGYFWGYATSAFASFDGRYVCVIGQHNVEVFNVTDLLGDPIVTLKNNIKIFKGSFIPNFPDILFLNSVKNNSFFYSLSLKKIILKLIFPKDTTVQSIAFPDVYKMLCKGRRPEEYIEVTLSPMLDKPQLLVNYLAIQQEIAKRQGKEIPQYLSININ